MFKKPQPPFVPDAVAINIDTALLQPCAPLKENVELVSFEQYLLVEYPEFIRIYTDCAVKQSNSVKLIKKLGNVK